MRKIMMHPPVWLLLLLLLLVLRSSTAIEVDVDVSGKVPLPLHLQNDFRSSITLRGLVLHSSPFAIVQQDEETGQLTASGLQMDLLERLIVFAAADGVALDFDLELWQYSPNHTYGTAVDLIANDCEEQLTVDSNAVSNITNLHGYDCNSFDLVIADLWRTAERYLRVDMTPPWLSNAISAMKYVGYPEKEHEEVVVGTNNKDITTLTEASYARATVCVLKDTHSSQVVMVKFPNIPYLQCFSDEECFDHLRDGRCVLFSRDELFLKAKQFEDPSFETTRERFNTQYAVWPIRYDLDPAVSYLLKRWITQAVDNTTMDELYYKYFEKETCPIGYSGENCDEPCDPDHGASDDHGHCICESPRWIGDDCSIHVEEDRNMIPASLKGFAYALFGTNVIVIVSLAGWLIRYRESDQVRASQPFFLMLVLLGCLISTCTILALAQEEDDAACAAIPWLYSFGFCVTFGTLFAKIRRVYLVFRQVPTPGTAAASRTLRSSFSSSFSNRASAVLVSFQETLGVIAAVTMVDVIILILWTIIDPLQWERVVIRADQYGAVMESHGYCTCDSWEIFGSLIGVLHLALISVACVLCYKARKIPTVFQEGKYVFIAMLANLQVLIVGLPILVIVGSDSQSSFFVRSVIIWMNNLAVLLLIFGNLMFNTHMLPSKSISARQNEINKAVFRFSDISGHAGKHSKASGSRSPASRVREVIKAEMHEKKDDEEDSEMPKNEVDKADNKQMQARHMISSLSLDSEQQASSSPLPAEPEIMPIIRERDLISSLSLGSATSGNSKNRSVTFGMAYVSEGNEDGSEADDRDVTSANKKVPLQRRSSSTGPPQRPDRLVSYVECTDDDGPPSIPVDKYWYDPQRPLCNAPPQRPDRNASLANLGLDDDDEHKSPDPVVGAILSHSVEYWHHPPEKHANSDNNRPPQRPSRVDSSGGGLDDDDDDDEHRAPDPIVATTRSHSLDHLRESQQSAGSSNKNMPPQRPTRVDSAAGGLDADDSDEEQQTETLPEHSPPLKPTRVPSTSDVLRNSV